MEKHRSPQKILNPLIILVIVLSFILAGDVKPSLAWDAPTLDGYLDDEYILYGTMTRYGDNNIHAPTGLDDYAAAYLYVLEDENYVYVFYHQDIFYANDNSYGENSIHWEVRPSGKREFNDIVESDRGEFTFEDAEGGVAAHFYVDQLSPSAGTPSGYANLGFSGGDGQWLAGYADQSYFSFSSPMDYNLNSTGYCSGGNCTCGTSGIDLLSDSPEASGDYEIVDSGCSDWVWYNGWEIVVDKTAFGVLGFGVVIGNHHNSPTKTCQKNKDCPTDLYVAYSSIGDRVWHDLDGQGDQDSGEPGIQGVTVNLIDPRMGTIIESQVTNAQGEYTFEELSHMYYIVQVDESTLPPGFESTTVGNDDFNESYVNDVCGSDCIQRDGETYTRIYYIKLNHPEDYIAADFGYRPSGAVIGDYVWSDADHDGLQDLGEPGIGSVEIELLDGDGNPFDPVRITTTDDAGWYMFTNLEPGDYKVRVLDSNFDVGEPLNGYEYSPGAESSPSPTNVITLIADQAYVNADFGYYNDEVGSIGDFIWFDYNNNGKWFGEDEDPASGVTLALYLDSNEDGFLDPGEPVIANGITDSSGIYSFNGLELDQYYLVKVTDTDGVLDGYTITTYWGDDPEDPLDIDRYNDPAPIELTASEPDIDWVDFGYNSPGTIGDTVFYDWNENGSQDEGEIGVYGITVELSGEESDTTTTSHEGKYLFTERPSGDYEVEITVPSGYDITTGNPHSLSITGNQSYLDADFGIYRTAGDAYSLGNLVWYDSNHDGHKDATEPGIWDVTIAIYEDSNSDGVLDVGEPFIHSTITDSNGAYTFYGLLDGNYIIDVTDENGILSGYTLTDGASEDDNYSHDDPYGVTISGGNVNYVDFGYYYYATLAALSSFTAYQMDGEVIVEWETSSEVGTVGFILYRQDNESGDFQKVNENLLSGLLHAPQGGTYRYLDRGASPGETYAYRLLEIDHTGTQHQYGPFVVSTSEIRSGEAFVSAGAPYWKRAHEVQETQIESYRALGGGAGEIAPSVATGEYHFFLPIVIAGHYPEAPSGKSAKVGVSENGLYSLSAEDIADAMDLSIAQVEGIINDQQLQLVNKGQQISYLPDEGNAGIYFYGEAIESIYTSANVYWLIQGEGEAINAIDGEGPDPLVEEESFTQVLHFEEDHHALTALFDDPHADYWLWKGFKDPSDPPEVPAQYRLEDRGTFTFRSDGATGIGTETIDIYLHGVTETEANPDHHVIVRLNDLQIGESWWNGKEAHHFQMSFDADLLNDGENTLEVIAELDTGVPYSIFYLDSFDVTYERYYRASGDRLIFPGQDLSVITILDFSNPEISVFDITNPQEPVLRTATTVNPDGGKFSVSFEPEAGERQYLAVSLDGLSSPLSIVQDAESDLKANSNQADYLLITTDELLSSTQSLLTYRQGQGYQTMAVDLEDIYDEFSFGISTPEAIKAFLEHAHNQWATPPSFVVLFGAGTFDYKDNQAYGDNLVPAVLVSGLGGLFASDTYYADVVGDDGVPDFAIGRIPVLDSIGAGNVITKIESFESSNTDPWTNNVFMLADNPDDGGDFPADSDGVAALIPVDFNVETIYLSDLSINDARDQIIDGINSGSGFVNYIGHAGLDRLAQEGLLMSSDAASLTNGSMLTIVTAMTCVAGRFEIPGHEVFAETMLLDSDGGAIAVWSPTGLSINKDAVALDEYLVQAIFQDGVSTIGEAVVAALSDYASDEDHLRYMLEIYNLLGDPALFIGWNE